MNRRKLLKTSIAGKESISLRDLHPISLPKPHMDGGKSVLAALKERKTDRRISTKILPRQLLSDLLWAAFGVKRQNGPFGHRGKTSASASNSPDIQKSYYNVAIGLIAGNVYLIAASQSLAAWFHNCDREALAK